MKSNVVIPNSAGYLLRPELSVHPEALWRQLKQALRDSMIAELSPGDRIPAEEELCELYGVSRTTVRQAIASLVAEGVLFRRRGSGTYVARRKIEDDAGFSPANIIDISEQIRRSGAEPGVLLIDAAERAPDRRLMQALKVTGRDLLYKILRLRTAGSEPVAIQETFVPKRYCPDLLSADLVSGSLSRLIEARYGIVFVRIDAAIECVMADAHRAELLGIEERFPLVLIERTSVSESGAPVLFSRFFFRHDRYKLRMSVRPPR